MFALAASFSDYFDGSGDYESHANMCQEFLWIPSCDKFRLYWRHCVVLSKNMDDFVNDVARRNLRLLKAAVNCIGAVDSLHNRY